MVYLINFHALSVQVGNNWHYSSPELDFYK